MRILISAYACEPGTGSEPAAGWNWVMAAGRHHRVTVLTRVNNREAIERALAREPAPSVRFEFIDLPTWARAWKRGPRLVHLYYPQWQLLAGLHARRLHQLDPFDLVHHLTFANVWLPALAWMAPAPFVLGPVGGGVRIPFRLYRIQGLRGLTHELALLAFRLAGRFNPLVRRGWKRARVIVVRNHETRDALPAALRNRVVVRPDASVPHEIRRVPRSGKDRRVAVCAGRLLPWKGVLLAIAALHHAPGWELVIVGKGHDEGRLRETVARAGLENRVTFVPWLPQAELWARIADSAALVLPSLREDASFVAVEAQALGTPVVAFAQGGPAVLARFPGAHFELVPLTGPQAAAPALGEALRRLSEGAYDLAAEAYGLDGIEADLEQIYHLALGGELLASSSLELRGAPPRE